MMVIKICCILAGVCFLIYANSLNGAFVCDDIPAILTNPLISRPFRFWLQPPDLLNSFNYFIAGYNPFIYHLTNVILHSINTILVFFFLHLFFKTEVSFLGACLFAVHPIHTEAVTWISGKSYLFLAFFILITYLLYHRARNPLFRDKGINLFWYSLSLFTFSYFIISNYPFFSFFPLFLILSDLTLNLWRRNWKWWLPFLAILIVRLSLAQTVILHRIIFMKNDMGVPALRSLAYPVYSLYTYLGLLIWPAKLTLYHEPIILSGTLHTYGLFYLLPIILLLLFTFKSAREIFLGLSIFIIFLTPSWSPIRVASLVAERYLYFPSLILSIFAAFLYDRYTVKYRNLRNKILTLFIFIIVAYALRTVVRNEDWRSPQRFWRETLKISYNSSRAHNNMGEVYYQEGNSQEAVRELKKAIKINPNEATAHNNLGNIFADIGKREEAIASYQKAIEINPGFQEAYFNIGNIFADIGKREEAIASYQKAIEINPNFVKVYINLGRIFADIGKREKAIASYQKAIEINPRYAIAHNNLAVEYYYEKQYDLAVRHCDIAIKLGYRVHPDFLKSLEPYQK